MDSCKVICFLFIFPQFLITVSGREELCSSLACRQGEAVIRFPFRLENRHPKQCGYAGFDLFCDAQNRTIIELPSSGQFAIKAIDYETQTLRINDPQNCLAKHLLTLNLSGSPFTGIVYQDFTMFNCTIDYSSYGLYPIACLSGENYAVYASSRERAISFFASLCNSIATIAVPVYWTFLKHDLSSDLSGDLLLQWVTPICGGCESRGRHCGPKGNSSTEVECSYVSEHGLPKALRYTVVFGGGLPVLFVVGLVCYICGRMKRRHMSSPPVVELISVGPPHTTALGLDSSTIESYPKTVLGESWQSAKPEDSICPICLSEYMPKDTIRSIPDCQHCFHAECIDEWLRIRASCPVCRTSPDSS